MNKKILAKTLLPISSIALLGGGWIATSLTLTSCSKNGDLTFKNVASIIKYLKQHTINPIEPAYTTSSTGSLYDICDVSLLQTSNRVQTINFTNLSKAVVPGRTSWTKIFGNAESQLKLIYTYTSDSDFKYTVDFNNQPTPRTLFSTALTGDGFNGISFNDDRNEPACYWNPFTHILSLSLDYTYVYSVSSSIINEDPSVTIPASIDIGSLDYLDASAWTYFVNNINKQTAINKVLYELVDEYNNKTSLKWVKIIDKNNEVEIKVSADENFSRVIHDNGSRIIIKNSDFSNYFYPDTSDQFDTPHLYTPYNKNEADEDNWGYHLSYGGNYVTVADSKTAYDIFSVSYTAAYWTNSNKLHFEFV